VRTTRYTHGHHASVVDAHATRTADDSAAYLLPLLAPGMSLLDVGCGPGSVTLDLAAAVAPSVVVGIEPGEGVLATAHAAAAARGDVTTRFEQADVMDLPYADASFDVVHAHQVLQHLADPVGALREMRRVCRPGGLVAVRDADYAAMTWWPPTEGMTAWLSTYRELAHANGAEPDAGRRLLSWALEAGLQDVTGSASTWCYATAESRGWWSESWQARAMQSAFADQALEAGRSREDLEAYAAGWREWGAAPDGWFVVVHGEVLARA
jgi:ubiquinone/menaquinone biosynthesis C-methylase UbiE